jgi:hypothetical protein
MGLFKRPLKSALGKTIMDSKKRLALKMTRIAIAFTIGFLTLIFISTQLSDAQSEDN